MPNDFDPIDPAAEGFDPINNQPDPSIDPTSLCGWLDRPADVEQVLASIPKPLFGDAASQLAGTWDGKSVKLWDACIKVTGANLPADKQTIGDCVSHGHARGIDYLQCVQIAIGKLNNEYIEGKHSCYSEAIYGMMRKRANQLSMQDGAAGAWAVASLTADGCPVRNGRTYDGQKAKQWGARGTPEDISNEGKSEILKQFLQVQQVNEAADLLSNGYPITICSSQGFSMTRDSQGIARAQGSWNHCMLCIGLLMISGKRYFTILQSWGQNTPSGPTIENMPDNSFNCEESVFARILNARDSYALSGLPGFPAQDLNFFV